VKTLAELQTEIDAAKVRVVEAEGEAIRARAALKTLEVEARKIPSCELGEIVGCQVLFTDGGGDRCYVGDAGDGDLVFGEVGRPAAVLLTRRQVAALTVVLQRFLNTGRFDKVTK
jgi:hypothetical protein